MDNITFAQLRKITEEEARGMLEAIRWPDGAVCPHCGSTDAHKLEPKAEGKTHVRPGVYFCGACRKQFTVTVGTIFEGSRIKIADWLMAIYLMCSSKKGISAHQLHRTIGVTYKTAWFMAHRIRFAMTQEPLAELISGEVEVDQTYIGGKEKWKHASKKLSGSQGGANKVPVFALVERGGELRAKKIRGVTNYGILDELRKNVRPSAQLMTDESNAYLMADREYPNRRFVTHGSRQYVNGDVHTNTLEGWFALLKRGVTGTFHHVSEQHLDRYVDEFAFRYNSRKITDAERTVHALRKVGGKRLTYRETKSH
jgi:transposase-like protein